MKKKVGVLEYIPMLRPLIALSLGILLARYTNLSSLVFVSFAAISVSIGFIILLGKWGRLSVSASSGLFFLLALSGFGATLYQKGETKMDFADKPLYYSGVVDKVIKQDTSRARLILYLSACDTVSFYSKVPIIATFQAPNKDILPGDEIYFKGSVQEIPPPSNPGMFDVKAYYGHKWIYYQTQVWNGQYQIFQSDKFSISRLSYQAALWSRNKIKQALKGESAATMQAILLGIKQEVSAEMLSTYQNVGVMHILAVSGMHVMLIYGGLVKLTSVFRRRFPFISWLPLPLIWIFSFVTGSGPAVIRAALTLTLIDIGTRSKFFNHSVNLLFSSAVILLLLQPYLLWDIGFQLSYAAMLGIFMFYKPFSDLLYLKNKWLKSNFWDTSVLSVAAQLGTTPLTLYYFGNFPVYFLLSNILVLFPVILILYGGVILLFLGLFLPQNVMHFIGIPLDFVIKYGFIYPLQWLEDLPGAFVRYIHLDFIQVIFLVIGIMLFAQWINNLKSGKWLVYSLSCILITISISTFRQWNIQTETRMLIADVNKHSVVAVGSGSKVFLWTDSIFKQNPGKADFQLSGMMRLFGWKKSTFIEPDFVQQDSSVMLVGSTSFMKLQAPIKKYSSNEVLRPDYLFLNDKVFLDTTAFKQRFQPGLVVLDGSLSNKKRRLFTRLLSEAKIPFHDTRTQGALLLEIKH